jgi:hypothetical protein
VLVAGKGSDEELDRRRWLSCRRARERLSEGAHGQSGTLSGREKEKGEEKATLSVAVAVWFGSCKFSTGPPAGRPGSCVFSISLVIQMPRGCQPGGVSVMYYVPDYT